MTPDGEESLRTFIAALAELRARVGGPSYRELQRLNPERLRTSTVHGMLEGERRRPPSWPLVDAYVRACLAHGREHGMRLTDDVEAFVGEWLARHGSVAAAMSRGPEPQDEVEDSRPLILGGGTPPVRGHFSGRHELMEELDAKMAAQTAWPVCLLGPGGHGKTQLASEYIHRRSSRYTTVWWIRAEQPSLVRTDLAALGRRLGLDLGEPELVAETLSLLQEDSAWGPWLLVFDNAGHPATLVPPLPRGGSGHVLITSRDPAWDEVAVPVEVGVFQREDSVELLTRRVPGISSEEAAQVAEELGDLPLGIVQAGSYIKGSGLAPGAYLALLRAQPGRMLEKYPPVDYGSGLASAWNLGFETLAQSHPEAMRLLQRCAFLRPESITRGLLLQGALPLPGEPAGVFRDPVLADNAIRTLTRYGFMRLAGRGTVQVHRLLQSTVKELLPEEERERVRHDVHRLLAGADCGDPEDRATHPRYAELAGHAEASGLAGCTDDDVRAFVAKLVRYFQQIGDGDGAERYAGVALTAPPAPAGDGAPQRTREPAPARPARRGSALAREMEHDDWTRLIYQISTGDCTPVVGAETSRQADARLRALSWEWAGRLGYPYADAWNVESVLDFAMTLPDRAAMAEEVLAALRGEAERPQEADDPYAFLAKIPATSYLTTCYDDRLTRALLQAGREPVVKVPPWRPELLVATQPVVAPTPERPLVCHLAGTYDSPDTLVLTRGDRLRCMRVEYGRWSADIIGALVTYPFLILGYNPRSASYELLMSLLSGITAPKRNIVALHDPDPGGMEATAKEYNLARISRQNMRAGVYWGDAREFIRELSHRLEPAG
ncbi:FxSxx-COOH system tetratricopeptide repeat protein [Nonomuraea jiangxiensis]|uniref:SIR2-like domain-containing protein n=1 Tax=Nonomuraea jiangxiensis TaxID=633440 RepID=A0A1G9D9P0_9ACTN|nr:FxSxx-COOH system tetratricopeptide repeat protein [Nonomuraea jiangxiensis]SDK60606.1 SIR2-like domain-containing protein [Nonomuraea jiangxiensis]